MLILHCWLGARSGLVFSRRDRWMQRVVCYDPIDGNEVFFRIKRSTQLKKLMNAYCDRQSVDFNSIAFLFDGRRLRAEQTPDELEMEDGDEIDAMLHQTGGTILKSSFLPFHWT
ncbi:Small ubiquitin-related modifier 1 [Capsicum annuum]|uniref:Small ubiquitin-related modifier n=1 Tax=Capsicum annuum TaxID=4072 RepID=A0A2G2YU28_CAPAN|nr:Small ubiquitin-related modifier 1 [Capsicum annuum]